MGGRYYITGVQIGMLVAFAQQEKYKDVLAILKGIEDRQFVCSAEEFKKLIKKWKQ